jgi:hypothetical protein
VPPPPPTAGRLRCAATLALALALSTTAGRPCQQNETAACMIESNRVEIAVLQRMMPKIFTFLYANTNTDHHAGQAACSQAACHLRCAASDSQHRRVGQAAASRYRLHEWPTACFTSDCTRKAGRQTMMPLPRIHIAAALTLAASRCAIGSAQSTLSTNTHVVGHNTVHGRVTQTTTQMLYTTFELSLVKAPFNADVVNCYALYGSGNTSMALPPAWQAPNPFGVNIGGVHPAITAIAPSARFDSWLTIGPDSGGAAAQEIASVGIRWHEWTAESGLSTDDGAVFWIDPSKAPPLTASSGVKVGQLT